jgi:hypothetical protein
METPRKPLNKYWCSVPPLSVWYQKYIHKGRLCNSVNIGSRLSICSDIKTRKRWNVVGIDDSKQPYWLKLWRPSCQKLLSPWNCYIIEMMTGLSSEKLYRGPYIDAFCQVWFHLVQLFQRSRLKYEKLWFQLSTYISSRLPEHNEDPLEFIPERFLSDSPSK